MKLRTMIKGFTLIELLVVITIIGILATGWVAVFTTQLQWSRDTLRLSDLKLMETALNQYYSDTSIYPGTSLAMTWATKQYMSKSLKDPKSGQSICYAAANTATATCQWLYKLSDDANWLADNAFKLWVRFEKEANFTNKAANSNDGWNYAEMFELYQWSSGSTIDLTNSPDIVY